MPMTSGSEQEYCPNPREESDSEIRQQVQRHFSEDTRYGRRTQGSPGTILLSRRGEKYASLPLHMLQGIQQSPLFETGYEERLCHRGHRDTKGNNGTRPQDTYTDTTRLPQECGSWNNGSNAQPQHIERNGQEGQSEQSDPLHNDGISGLQMPEPTKNTGSTKTQVTSIALQTDLCSTLYMTKEILVAYTIAVVQNTQTLQYEQIQVALQTAQNQASLEMPLWAEQLMTAHFNLVVLTEEPTAIKNFDAPKPETEVVDATPSTSADDEETYVKIPSRNNSTSRDTKRLQPTGAVSPTRRREYGLVNGILAGYESDDSWGNDSHALEPEHIHSHSHNIVPLLALRTWSNCPNRGTGQNYRQNNNITVRNGDALYQRPWEGQPYRWCTRS